MSHKKVWEFLVGWMSRFNSSLMIWLDSNFARVFFRAVQILRIDDFKENQIQNRINYRSLDAIGRDSNPRPNDPEVNELPIELLPQFFH